MANAVITPSSHGAPFRRRRRSSKRHTVLFTVTITILFLSAGSLAAQYTGPEIGSIPGGATVTTGEMAGLSDNISPDQSRLPGWYRERLESPLADDIYNTTSPSGPLGSNVFIDPGVDPRSPLVSDAPGVVIDFEGIPDRGTSIPPDPIIAAGPDHIMALVNSEFIIFDKQGNEIFRSLADPWLRNVLPSVNAFDPWVIYDHFDERWVMLWDHWDDVNEAYWLLSVSDDADPMGTWCNFAFRADLNGMTESSTWGDYPKMAYDEQAIYVSGRQFNFTGGFRYCKIRTIPKFQLYAGDCGEVFYSDLWDFRDPENVGQRVDGPPIAATHLEPTDNIAYFVVDAPYNTSTFITLWTIEDPVSLDPIVSAVNIPTTEALEPPDADQLGGGDPRIDSGRRAYRNAVYKDGQIWTATAVAGGTGNQYAFARYLRLSVDPPSVIEDVAMGADGYYYLYPAIMVDEANNMVMVFSRSADDEYCGAAYTGRREGEDAPAPSVILKEGEANYVKTYSGTRNRWGDYMGIAQDPFATNIIWSLIEYAASPENTYGTWVGAFGYEFIISGVVRDAGSGDPLELATMVVTETGNTITTDSTGVYSFASPVAEVTVNVSAFAYQDTTITVTIPSGMPDVLDIELEPEITAAFSGQVLDPVTQEGVAAELAFYAHGNPDPGPYVTASTDSAGNFSVETIIGMYDIVADGESPYETDVHYDSLAHVEGGTYEELAIRPADVMLVDDDDGSGYEAYFIRSLENLEVTYHWWERAVDGVPTPDDVAAYPDSVVIWFTGDGETTTIDSSEAATLAAHLSAGGKLLLTGQNIAEHIDGNELMSILGLSYLQDNENTLVFGIAGSFAEGQIFTTSGSGGADNQTSRDQLVIEEPGTTRGLYQYGNEETDLAGVSFGSGSARAVFLGFGWEAIFNEAKRDETLDVILAYFDMPTGIGDTPVAGRLPAVFRLEQNFPNPFNPSTTIAFDLAGEEGELHDVTLVVYDMRGRQVRVLVDAALETGGHRVHWDGRNDRGERVASGIYLFTLQADDKSFTRKMAMVK